MQIRVFSHFFTSDQHNWPNARAFDEFRSHFVTVGKIDQMRCAFGRTRSAIGQTCARLANRVRNWPKRCAIGQMPRVRDCPNAQIGQMRLTITQRRQTYVSPVLLISIYSRFLCVYFDAKNSKGKSSPSIKRNRCLALKCTQ